MTARHAIHGDRTLAFRGDPETGEPVEDSAPEHHIWDIARVRALVADRSVPATAVVDEILSRVSAHRGG
ncbi:hypothetical protein ABTZ46_12780 [Nocardioides sp. NPDC126508]